MKTLRCAVYTRKSNEEGLDQAFNSLDAQREAGLDYIKSQKHEGWKAVPEAYDDGGFSGATMKRPALDRLLADIDKGRVDVVVVYKVDRLSRSLGDFARMMQLFDEKQVSFVSVTQQFNTTTSMGRLTLNMLLSFAQFEREVTGERIRDKIAATKKQGYWVCGQPPLGYRRQREDEPRGIYIVPEEAALVREIFTRFLQTPSLIGVAAELNAAGHTTRRWTSSTGKTHGGRPLNRKSIYDTLTNPIYIGKIRHTRSGQVELHDGRHAPIIDADTWSRVQDGITSREATTTHRWTHTHLLKGKLRTAEGFAMSPSSTQRPLSKLDDTGQKRIIRYYVSQKAIKQGYKACPIKSLNAEHLDDLVRGIVLGHLANAHLNHQPAEIRDSWIRAVIDSVVLAPDGLTIRLDCDQLAALARHTFPPAPPVTHLAATCRLTPRVEHLGGRTELTLAIQIETLHGRRTITCPDGDPLVVPPSAEPKQHIIDAIGLAYRWHDELIRTGQPIGQFAAAHSIARSRVFRLLPLTHLGPPVLRAVFHGTLPSTLTLDDLITAARQLDWNRQAADLGIAF
jgi:site-specific DNA recombinase